jgi:hypothetical protein
VLRAAQRIAELFAGADRELGEQFSQVPFDRAGANEKPVADLRVGKASRASRAICFSCGVSSSRVSTMRLRTVGQECSRR